MEVHHTQTCGCSTRVLPCTAVPAHTAIHSLASWRNGCRVGLPIASWWTGFRCLWPDRIPAAPPASQQQQRVWYEWYINTASRMLILSKTPPYHCTTARERASSCGGGGGGGGRWRIRSTPRESTHCEFEGAIWWVLFTGTQAKVSHCGVENCTTQYSFGVHILHSASSLHCYRETRLRKVSSFRQHGPLRSRPEYEILSSTERNGTERDVCGCMCMCAVHFPETLSEMLNASQCCNSVLPRVMTHPRWSTSIFHNHAPFGRAVAGAHGTVGGFGRIVRTGLSSQQCRDVRCGHSAWHGKTICAIYRTVISSSRFCTIFIRTWRPVVVPWRLPYCLTRCAKNCFWTFHLSGDFNKSTRLTERHSLADGSGQIFRFPVFFGDT